MDGDKGKIPIIAVTADAMTEHKKGYFEAGMNEVVTKPIDRAELAEAINKVMDEEIHVPIVVEEKAAIPVMPSDSPEEEVDDEKVSAEFEALMQKIRVVAG